GWFQGTFAAKVDEGPMTPERVFPTSSKCKKCHLRANEEYEESTIARAIVSPTFRAMLEDYVSKGKDKRYCLNCHAPQSVVFPDLVDSMVKQIISGDLTFEGVGNWRGSKAAKEGKNCQTCHMPQGFDSSANEEKKRDIAGHEFNGKSPALRKQAFDLDYENEVQGAQTKLTVKLKNLVPHNVP